MFNLTHTKRSADKNKILYFTSQLDEDQKLAYWQCCRRKEEREVAQSFPTLCDPIDCSLPGFSIHRIFQARVLEWVAISFSRGSSRPRDQTQVFHIAGRRFTCLSHQGSQRKGTHVFLVRVALQILWRALWQYQYYKCMYLLIQQPTSRNLSFFFFSCSEFCHTLK